MQTQPDNEDVIKLVRNAGIFLRRGDLDAAEQNCRGALGLNPGDASSLELLGDILVARGQTQPAAECYHRAMQLAPQNASAELKYARLVLNFSQAARQEEELTAGFSNPEVAKAPPRNVSVSFMASALWPGLGQWYNGETTKAIILAVAYGLTNLLLLATGDMQRLLRVFVTLMAPQAHIPGSQQPISLLSAFLWGVGGMAWLYAVIDAPIRASQKAKSVNNYTEPTL